MNRIRRVWASDAFILALTGLVFAVFAAAAPGFASIPNVANIVISALPLLLLATGQTFVLIAGGIDLSSPAVVGLSSVAGALVMRAAAGHPAAASAGLLVMLAVGALAGVVNGISVAWFRMPPFMVTMASMTMGGGLAVWMAHAAVGADAIDGLPDGFLGIGRDLRAVAGLALVVVVLAGVLLERTLFGRWLRAVGHNVEAARVCGVPVPAVVIAAYVLSGVCAAFAGVLLTARLETGSPLHGRQLLLDVIGAAVIGGTSLFGARGSIAWTACGVMFLALLGSGLTRLNLSDFVITIVKGAVILAAALLDVWRTRWSRRES